MINQQQDESITSSEEIEKLKQRAKSIISKEREKTEECERVVKATRELLDEREKQMTSVVESWKEKLDEEKKKHEDFYNLTMQEFEDAVSRTENKFIKPSLRPICDGLQSSLVDCYKNHPNRTLECSRQVAEFSRCVENVKQNILYKQPNTSPA